MAGWDVYVKNMLDSDPSIDRCAIIGVPDGSLWTKSKPPNGKDFELKPEEVKKIGGMWAKYQEIPMTGVHAAGVKYVVPLALEDFVIGKNTANHALGIVCVKTGKACLVATFTGEREQGVKVRTALEKIGNYLKQQGY